MPTATTKRSRAKSSDVDLAALGERWRADPVSFLYEALDVDQASIWPKMTEICESVRDNPRTAVKAGHGVSKSYTAARLAMWFLWSHYPSTVITTAPTNTQVEEILWREIRGAMAHARCPILRQAEPTLTKLDLGPRWFATGFSTKPDAVTGDASRFLGFHNDHLLVIFDEASGILPPIWKAAQSLLTDGHVRWLCIGNPLSAAGDFVRCFDAESGWEKITVSVLDTPNYISGRTMIPGVSGREFAGTISEKYGKNSNEYRIRVLGEIPTYTEGTYYGSTIAGMREGGRIRKLGHIPSASVYTAWDVGYHTAVWFFQVDGPDIRVIRYYEAVGEGVEYYVRLLEALKGEHGYHYGRHFVPCDAHNNAMRAVAGDTWLERMGAMGVMATRMEREPAVSEGIDRVRGLLPRCWFDAEDCKEGLDSLSQYHQKKNVRLSTEGQPVYGGSPEHDWSSHGADAFRYLSMAVPRCRSGGILTVEQAYAMSSVGVMPT